METEVKFNLKKKELGGLEINNLHFDKECFYVRNIKGQEISVYPTPFFYQELKKIGVGINPNPRNDNKFRIRIEEVTIFIDNLMEISSKREINHKEIENLFIYQSITRYSYPPYWVTQKYQKSFWVENERVGKNEVEIIFKNGW